MFILADDLGYNDVPWHNPSVQAPHLQFLADNGVVLEQNYVQPKCAPSRAAILTGIVIKLIKIDMVISTQTFIQHFIHQKIFCNFIFLTLSDDFYPISNLIQ